MLHQLLVSRSLLGSRLGWSLLTDRSLNVQGPSAQQLPVVRVYMATPLGTFCADVSKALAEDRLQVYASLAGQSMIRVLTQGT